MTDHIDPLDEPGAEALAAIAAMLGRADIWAEPDPSLDDAVVAAISAEIEADLEADVGADPETEPETEPMAHNPVSLASRRRRTASPAWLAAAAALVVVVVVAAVTLRSPGDDGAVFALEGTDAAPGAWGEATVSTTPAGLKIMLVAQGLPGAPEGYMYEAWVSDGSIGVSAGTFHLRGGGDRPIELWAGVTDGRFQRLTITLEPVDGDATSSRDARLVGSIAADD